MNLNDKVTLRAGYSGPSSVLIGKAGKVVDIMFSTSLRQDIYQVEFENNSINWFTLEDLTAWVH